MLAPLFVLDEPQPHHLHLGKRCRVRGAVLAVDGPPIDRLSVEREGVRLAETPVTVPCPELAAFHVPNAGNSRFDCEVLFDREGDYILTGHTPAGDTSSLFTLNVTATSIARSQELQARVLAFPTPPAELVFTTQGGTDTQAYTDSAVSGILTLESLLAASGYDAQAAQAILDIGCGTGRLLLGWRAAGPDRVLAGVDVNPALIGWAQQSLANVAAWSVCDVLPPLPFESASFDVVQLASVFTHLPLGHQTQWLQEIRRLLKPGGAAVITLHGELYARMMFDETLRQRFRETGYVEIPGAEVGANAFATFHSTEYARALFSGFESVHFFPRGNEEGRARLFPIAALQDVYVLRAGL